MKVCFYLLNLILYSIRDETKILIHHVNLRKYEQYYIPSFIESMDEKDETMNLASSISSQDNHDVDDCGCLMCDNLSKKIHRKRKIKDKSIASKFIGIDRKINARFIIQSKGSKKTHSQTCPPDDRLNSLSVVDANNANLSSVGKKNLLPFRIFREERKRMIYMIISVSKKLCS